MIAAAGSGIAFLLNAVSFFGVIYFLYRWRGAAGRVSFQTGHMMRAMFEGIRHIRGTRDGEGRAGSQRGVQHLRQRIAGAVAAAGAPVRIARLRPAAGVLRTRRTRRRDADADSAAESFRRLSGFRFYCRVCLHYLCRAAMVHLSTALDDDVHRRCRVDPDPRQPERLGADHVSRPHARPCNFYVPSCPAGRTWPAARRCGERSPSASARRARCRYAAIGLLLGIPSGGMVQAASRQSATHHGRNGLEFFTRMIRPQFSRQIILSGGFRMKKEFVMANAAARVGHRRQCGSGKSARPRAIRSQPSRRYSTTRSAEWSANLSRRPKPCPMTSSISRRRRATSRACARSRSRSSTLPQLTTCWARLSCRRSRRSSSGSENGPDNITSKADVVKFLKDSFAYLHKALNTIDESNVLVQVQSPFGSNKVSRLGLATIALSHPLRSLRPDGGVPADERHHSSRQPSAVAVETAVRFTIGGASDRACFLGCPIPPICSSSSNIFSCCESLKLLAGQGVSAVGSTIRYTVARHEFITDVQKTRCHGAADDHLQRAHLDRGDVCGHRRLA